jgi:hypothetical protein
MGDGDTVYKFIENSIEGVVKILIQDKIMEEKDRGRV